MEKESLSQLYRQYCQIEEERQARFTHLVSNVQGQFEAIFSSDIEWSCRIVKSSIRIVIKQFKGNTWDYLFNWDGSFTLFSSGATYMLLNYTQFDRLVQCTFLPEAGWKELFLDVLQKLHHEIEN